MTIGVGVTVVGIMARYLLRRRPNRPSNRLGSRSPAASLAQEQTTQNLLRDSSLLDEAASVEAGK